MVVTRKCIVCGEEFEHNTSSRKCKYVRKDKYPICCNECREKANAVGKSETTVEYDGERMKTPPTLSDKMFIIDILHDFGISVDVIPEEVTKTTSKLFKWKDKLIKKRLDEF